MRTKDLPFFKVHGLFHEFLDVLFHPLIPLIIFTAKFHHVNVALIQAAGTLGCIIET